MAALWTDFLAVYLAFLKQLIPVVTFLVFLSSLDELLIDTLFGLHWVCFRLGKGKAASPPLTAAELARHPADWIAIFVPALEEEDVIGQMLQNTLARLNYPRYRILVGTYPDDPATQAVVRAVAARDPRVACIVGPAPSKGSTKAANLNVLYDAMLDMERAGHPRFKAVVLHDAEDVVHPKELYVFNYFIPARALVQIPVQPLAYRGVRWWGHTYLEEFAESHTRDMVVRAWLGASLPSAGVGCAFSRPALAAAAQENSGQPFRVHSKTEDYELGISLGLKGFPAEMVRISASALDPGCVATRGFFPDSFRTAVRQRSRWLLGITLKSWRHFGWPGSLVDRYMLLRDRKALPCAFINVLALALLVQLVAFWLYSRLPGFPGYPPLVEEGSLTALLLKVNLAVLAWRSGVRAAITTRHYGLVQGLLCVPRAIFGIFIQAEAARRAVAADYREWRTGRPTDWDKTAHRYLS